MTVWNKQEVELLLSCKDKNITYDELCNIITTKTRQQIISKVGHLKLSNFFSRKDLWTKEELELLYYCLNKNMSYKEASKTIKTKTEKQIKSKCNYEKITGFRRDSTWSDKEIEILYKYYPITKNNEITKYIKSKSKDAIINKAKELKIEKTQSLYENHNDKIIDNKNNLNENTIKRYSDRYGIILDINKMYLTYDVIQWYEWTIGKTPNGNKLVQLPQFFINKKYIKVLIRYVLEEKLNYKTREDCLNLTQRIIQKYKISFSKTEWIKNSPYNLLKIAYPEYDIKPYELVHATCNYWKNYDNFLSAFNDFICNLKNNYDSNSIINMINDKFVYENFCKLHSAKKLYFNDKTWHDISIDSKCGIVINEDGRISIDGTMLNSIEEKNVYDYIKFTLKINIKPISIKRDKKYKFTNKEYNENYIPDFIIKNKNKPTIIEYFGFYNENNKNKIFIEYANKTKRKIEYFNNLEGYNFIGLFPEDLKNNFKGVKEKLTPFYN